MDSVRAADMASSTETGYPHDMIQWSFNFGNVGDDERKQRLARGEEAMLRHLDHAQFVYNAGFDVPDSPPDVEFFQTSNAQAKIVLEWPNTADQAIHPDYGMADVAGYRVYRSIWQETGPWILKADIPKGSDSGGKYSWVDEESLAGFSFGYSVRGLYHTQDQLVQFHWNDHQRSPPNSSGTPGEWAGGRLVGCRATHGCAGNPNFGGK